MPRRPKSDAQRAADVAAAVEGARRALTAALAAASDPGVSEAERRALWESVEQHGAVIHRQSRLLAGKPKGG